VTKPKKRPPAAPASGEAGLARARRPRHARVCPKCQARQFGDPKWKCPEHGQAVDQPDRPYP
jgi:hypothetical protein